MTIEGRPHQARIDSGNAELDSILWGGFPENSINVIMGEPGTGKTLLVEELLFNACSDERPGVFLTTLSEPLGKVVRYLQQYSFFDGNKVSRSIHYRDIGQQLVNGGVQELVDSIRQILRELQPRLIVIDSFRAVHDLTDSIFEARRVVHDIAGMLTSYAATTFLVGEYTDDHVTLFPEFAVADGIVQLTRERTGDRDDRFLRVLKLRGSGYEEGGHAFEIGDDGLHVYPRLVTPIRAADYRPSDERLSFGITGLDQMLHGGVIRGSTTLLVGPTGCGKTTTALQFATSAPEDSVYVTFQEHPNQLSVAISKLRHASGNGSGQEPRMLYYPPVELYIDRVIRDVFELISEDGRDRVIIDAVGDIATAAPRDARFHDYMYSMILHLAARGVTTVLLMETEGPIALGPVPHSTRISQMVDNIVAISVERSGTPRSDLQIVKTRGSAHDPRPRQFQIEDRGIVFVDPY